MKLVPRNVDEIIKVIATMRGRITRGRIHERVEAKIVKISARQLFAHPAIRAAYQDKRAEVKEKKTAKPVAKAPANSVEVIERQQHTIAKLEEKIALLYANAAANGVSPERLEQPMRPIDFGNTYRREAP